MKHYLGDPAIMFDQTGSLATTSRHDYLPFGEELFAGMGGRTPQQGYVGDNVRQKFTEKERDAETGLDYFLARYYSSVQARFTTADPVILTTQRLYDPQQINRYNYCRGNPVKFIDATGQEIILANARAIERAKTNIDVALRENERKNVAVSGDRVVLVDKSAIDLSKASVAYRALFTAITDDKAHRYFALAPGESARATRPEALPQGVDPTFTFDYVREANGRTATYSNGDSDSFVPVADDMTVEGLEPGTQIPQPEWRSWYHEVLGHGLSGLSNNEGALTFENAVAADLGLPLRSGKDHTPLENNFELRMNVSEQESGVTTTAIINTTPIAMRPLKKPK